MVIVIVAEIGMGVFVAISVGCGVAYLPQPARTIIKIIAKAGINRMFFFISLFYWKIN